MAGSTLGQIKKDKRSKKKQQTDFLQWFSEYASIARACKKAKVARSNIYQWFKSDVDFKALFDGACEVALGALEDEAVRRAHEGVAKPVFQGGKKVGSVKEYSDTLMIVLLKARAPEKYKERVHKETTGLGGGPIKQEATIIHDEIDYELLPDDVLLAIAKARKVKKQDVPHEEKNED